MVHGSVNETKIGRGLGARERIGPGTNNTLCNVPEKDQTGDIVHVIPC